MTPAVRLERVAKRFPRRIALAEFDLTLESGDFVLLVGPNGSGKTTLLRLLAGVTRPSTGTILRDGMDSPEEARRRTAYAGHHPLAYDELSARENLTFVLRMHTVPDVHSRATRWLDHFGLSDRADERVEGFSRGTRQRLALARTFALEASLILLDEPGTALDTQGMEALLRALRGVASAATIVVATHDPDPFRPLARRTLELVEGRLRQAEASA